MICFLAVILSIFSSAAGSNGGSVLQILTYMINAVHLSGVFVSNDKQSMRNL